LAHDRESRVQLARHAIRQLPVAARVSLDDRNKGA
jgi:hypothetical protein